MNLKTRNPFKAMCLVPLTALWLASTPAQAQTAPSMSPSARKPMGQMHKGAGGSHDMKAMARQIIVAQKKEIAQFDKWLAKQK